MLLPTPARLQTLPILAGVGATGMTGSDVSGDGRVIVGDAHDNFSTLSRAFRWTQEDGTEEIPLLSGFPTYGTRVFTNYDGTVVTATARNGAATRAVRWTSAGGTVDITGGAGSGPVEGISHDGNVIAGGGFVWNPTDGMIPLDDTPGAFPDQDTYCVSGDGSAVGGITESDTLGFGVPTIWNANDGTIREYLYPYPTGWQDDEGYVVHLSYDGLQALVIAFDENYDFRSAIWDGTSWTVLAPLVNWVWGVSKNLKRVLLEGDDSRYHLVSPSGTKKRLWQPGTGINQGGMSDSGHIVVVNKFIGASGYQPYRIMMAH